MAQWSKQAPVSSEVVGSIYKRCSGKEGDKEGTFHVEIKQEPELQGCRNSDLQFKSKAVRRSWKHLLSQRSEYPYLGIAFELNWKF